VRELDTADTAPSVRFGFELALWNLQAALSEKTLPEFVTSRPRATVPVSALISGPPDKALEDARAARAAGYEAVKLKVGGRPVDEDIELVCAVGGVLGDGVALRLDANRAWSVEEAERVCRDTAVQRIEYVEEPLADPSLLPSLVRECGLPVALDESLVRMPPEALEEYRYVRAAVIKPTLIGGLSRTLRLANRARELGITPVVSSAYETGVGTTALVALAAGIGEVPAGLGTYRRLAADVLLPRLELPAPRLDVRARFAARREIDRSRLIPVR
jgi:O-succinylbenzoate synthase